MPFYYFKLDNELILNFFRFFIKIEFFFYLHYMDESLTANNLYAVSLL